MQRREASKSLIIAYIHEIRKAYRHLAGLLYQEGLLPNTDLIFFLTKDELSVIMQKDTKSELINKSEIIMKATRRLKLYPAWNTLRFNEFNQGVPKPIEENLLLQEKIIGTPVFEGIVTGRACVLKSFADVSKIMHGDILITIGTDIGWSPYFPILGGVVTELGGLISHGLYIDFSLRNVQFISSIMFNVTYRATAYLLFVD